jgi:hypothetical protein
MKPHDLKSMSVDELLSLHEFVSAALARKIPAEKPGLISDYVSSVWAPCLTMLRR